MMKEKTQVGQGGPVTVIRSERGYPHRFLRLAT